MFHRKIQQFLIDLSLAPRVSWQYRARPHMFARMAYYETMAVKYGADVKLGRIAYTVFEPVVGFLRAADLGGEWITPLCVALDGKYPEGYDYLDGEARQFVLAAIMADYRLTIPDYMKTQLRCLLAEDALILEIRTAIKSVLKIPQKTY